MKMTKALIFDFFGVICSEIAPFWLDRYVDGSKASFLKEMVVGAADRGDISQDEMFKRLATVANISSKRVEDEWYELVHIDNSVVEFIRCQAFGRKVALLTNSPSPFVRSIIRTAGLEQLFHSIVVSSEQRVAKPESEIFRIVLDHLGLEPQHAIMIDDNKNNVDGAIRNGMEGILYRSYPSLREKLIALGEISDA